MSQRNNNPHSKQQAERLIIRDTIRFNGGMQKDLEPSELPNSSMYHLENAVGFVDAIEGRRGTAKFADRRLPLYRTFNCKVEDGIVTGLTDTFDTEDFSKIACFWQDGIEKSVVIREVYDDGTARIDTDKIPNIENTIVGIRGIMNGSFYDTVRSIIIIVVGDNIYHSTLYYAEDEVSISEWNKVVPIGRNKIDNSYTTIHIINDTYYVNNSHGVFRIDTANDVYWKCNFGEPKMEEKLDDIPYLNPLQYGYRYIYTKSRFDKDYTGNRLNDTILHETCPPVISDYDERDYSLVYYSKPVGVKYFSMTSNFDITGKNERDPLYWSSMEKVALKIRTGEVGADSSEWTTEYAYFDFTNVKKFLDVFTILKNGFDGTSCQVELTYTEADYDSIKIIYHFMTNRVIHEIAEYDLTDTEGVYSESSKFYSIMYVPPSTRVVTYTDEFKVNNPIRKFTDTTGCFSHYSIYRTYDVSGFENPSDVLSRIRDINDPNIYTWVDDIPVMEVYQVHIVGENVVTSSWGFEPLERNIGCNVKILDTERKIIGIYDNGVDRGYVLNSTLPLDDIDSSIVIGYGDNTAIDNVIPLLNADYTVFISGVSDISKYKIGSLIFFSDGSTAVVSNIDSTNIYLYDYNEDSLGLELACASNPGTRAFNDNVSDRVLEARNRTLPLKTRFFQPMRDNNLCCVIPGFYISSRKSKGEFEYCTTGNLSLIGFRHQVGQVSDYIDGDIQSVSWVNGVVSLKTSRETYTLNTQQVYDAGDSRYNESFLSFHDPVKVSDKIGVRSPSNVVSVDSGLEVVFTNEPAIRFFDGSKYGEDISKNKVLDSYVIPFYPRIIMNYDDSFGVKIWGYSNDK